MMMITVAKNVDAQRRMFSLDDDDGCGCGRGAAAAVVVVVVAGSVLAN